MPNKSLPLKGNVGPRTTNQRDDVTMVQLALGTIKPRPGARPFYHGRVDGQAGPKTEGAIRAFQASQNEQLNGLICPNTPCHRKLVDAAKKELQSQPKPPKPHLTFDGSRLCWIGVPHQGKCWNGVSGAKGFQSKEHQDVKDKGPLPEGRWRVRQDRYQKFDDIPLWNQLISRTPWLGLWPGGPTAWGRNRIWIEPAPGTISRGRTDLAIHGGDYQGSAGCVDLTHQMPDFTKHFRNYGGDMDLIVKY